MFSDSFGLETFLTGIENQNIEPESEPEQLPPLMQMEQLFSQNLNVVTPETFVVPEFDETESKQIESYINSF